MLLQQGAYHFSASSSQSDPARNVLTRQNAKQTNIFLGILGCRSQNDNFCLQGFPRNQYYDRLAWRPLGDPQLQLSGGDIRSLAVVNGMPFFEWPKIDG